MANILKSMKTVWVDDKPWSSPDGKVTIWKIKLEDPSGDRQLHSTMSKLVATEGFEGDIEIYTNDKGRDYVRQAPKEDANTTPSNASTGSTWQTRDDLAIRAQWAIGQAVQVGMATNDLKLERIEGLGESLFHMVERVKNSKPVVGHQQVQSFNEQEDEPPLTDADLPAEFRGYSNEEET